MLWLAVHLPALSLEAFCATLAPDAGQRPVALVAAHRVQAVNAAAADCGVRPGLKRATALALAADLLLAEADAARDAAALRAVAHAALAFTPSVALHDSQTVLLEVQASLRLFGGLAVLRQKLLLALAPLGHRVQLAAAPTALGAVLLAQWHPAGRGSLVEGAHATQLAALLPLLDDAPVAYLCAPRPAARPQVAARGGAERSGATQRVPGPGPGPGRHQAEALQGMGLHTLADLRRLPRDGLARRFGEDLLGALDRALGVQPDPRRWLTLPSRFDSRLELFARADTTDQVLNGAAVLLARLVAWAQARRARVGAFTLRMLHERQRRAEAAPTELHIALAEPALDAAHLQLLLRERLAQVALAAPTLELQLQCRHLVAGEAPSGELFPTRASMAEGLARLLERLRARLGDAQVQRLRAVADHRPERASRGEPAQPEGKPAALAAGGAKAQRGGAALPALPRPDADRALPLHRPAWLLPEPLPLAERDAQPLLDGRPLQLVSGPERIETGWWDGEPAARDYFIAVAEGGALVWVWRGRLPASSEGPGQPAPAGDAQWFLQGRFA
jgi:protein ImuB